jgi:uncharacterized protein (DUF58 family)
MIARLQDIARSLRWAPMGRTTQKAAPLPVPDDLLDEALLGRLRAIQIDLRNLPTHGLAGEHRSRQIGPSPEFSDFRPYTIGDDFRRIDWNAYARFDELFIRESETTTEIDVHVLLDLGPTMAWSSDDRLPTKARYGLRLTAALGYLSLWHLDRFSVRPLGVGGPMFGPIQGRSAILPMMHYLQRLPAGEKTDPVAAMTEYIWRRRPGSLLLISDLVGADPEPLEAALRSARGRGWRVRILQIQDLAEADPGDWLVRDEVTELVEAGTRARMTVRGNSRSRQAYLHDRQQWLDALQEVATQHGIRHDVITTDQAVDDVIIATFGMPGAVSR